MSAGYSWWDASRTGESAIEIGSNCMISDDARLDGASGKIHIGDRCQIHPGAMLLPYGGTITLGDECSVNPYTIIYGHGGVTIGNQVRIATHTVIIPANHTFADVSLPICKQPLTTEGIIIEDDVWIGCNVTILDGTHIGRGTVVAAGSVVRGRHEPMSIIGGTPARLLRKRQ